MHDRDYFLRVLERAFPADYVEGVQQAADGGWELFAAAAAVGARAALATDRMAASVMLEDATGATKSAGVVRFRRTGVTAGGYTAAAGKVIVGTSSGKRYLTTSALAFGVADVGPHDVTIEAVAWGPEFDARGAVTTAAGQVIPGEINEVVGMVSVPQVLDLELTVEQVGDVTGGRAPTLDAIGADLDVLRNAGEGDEEYRLRIRETPDTVSPAAIRRGLTKMLASVGAAVDLREAGAEALFGMFYDVAPGADPKRNFAYDVDVVARPEDARKCYLSFQEMRGFFLVGVPRLGLGEFGFAWDGDVMNPPRLHNAFDLAPGDAGAGTGAYDGSPAGASAFYRSIWSMLEAKHAGGVGFDLVLNT